MSKSNERIGRLNEDALSLDELYLLQNSCYVQHKSKFLSSNCLIIHGVPMKRKSFARVFGIRGEADECGRRINDDIPRRGSAMEHSNGCALSVCAFEDAHFVVMSFGIKLLHRDDDSGRLAWWHNGPSLDHISFVVADGDDPRCIYELLIHMARWNRNGIRC